MAAEAPGERAGAVRLHAELLQHAAARHQRRIQSLALDQAHAALVQLRPVAGVARACHDRQVGEVLARQVHERQVLLHVVDRHHQDPGALGTRHPQQVQARGIAVVDAKTETP